MSEPQNPITTSIYKKEANMKPVRSLVDVLKQLTETCSYRLMIKGTTDHINDPKGDFEIRVHIWSNDEFFPNCSIENDNIIYNKQSIDITDKELIINDVNELLNGEKNEYVTKAE